MILSLTLLLSYSLTLLLSYSLTLLLSYSLDFLIAMICHPLFCALTNMELGRLWPSYDAPFNRGASTPI